MNRWRDGLAPHGANRRTLALGLIVVVLVVAAGFKLEEGGESRASAADRPRASNSEITLAYAGDSTTAQPDSWLSQLDDPQIIPVGGFARSGFTSEQVLRNIHPVDADVLVVMVGINDFHFAASNDVETVVADVNLIVKRVGARQQIISAVAPSDLTNWAADDADPRELQTSLNRALKRDAVAHHWTYTDPYSLVRNPTTGGYSDSALTIDGIHPTRAAYAVVRASLIATIRQVVRTSPASR